MFDITSSKLFLLAIVALLVIGPKDFPVLLRTIGKYVGIIRGHAREFRAQFDEAMRESELAQMKKDMENLGRETEASLGSATQSVEQTIADVRQSVDGQLASAEAQISTGVTNPLAPASEPAPQPAPVAAQQPNAAEPASQPSAPEPAGSVNGAAAPPPPAAAPAGGQSAPEPAIERTTGA